MDILIEIVKTFIIAGKIIDPIYYVLLVLAFLIIIFLLYFIIKCIKFLFRL